jgi:hypothetical protein
MKVVMDDVTERELGPNDAAVIPPGHDAWIEGDEPCVWLEFGGASQYTRGVLQGGKNIATIVLIVTSRSRG